MLFIKKSFLNLHNKKFINFKNKFGEQFFFKYFLKHKKKRKIFRFTGTSMKTKNKSSISLKIKLHKEIFFINFFIFNPFVFLIRFNKRKKIIYLYKDFFITFLIEIVCSQYIFKKYLFLFKTKYRFR